MLLLPKRLLSTAIALIASESAYAQTSEADAARIRTLEAEVRAAQERVRELERTIAELASDVEELAAGSPETSERTAATSDEDEQESFEERILVPDLGDDDRDDELSGRPELFVQGRYFANPIDEASEDDVTRNFSVSRMEARWAGRVSERVGMGFEVQLHPAAEGAAEELINDAYVEYYPSESLTIRAGQFIKPFGFDIQHSSSARESPERAIFTGYFFPGQRDRGLMLTADLGANRDWLRGTTLYAGVLNGNRFFDDDNSELNYNLRIRKVLENVPLAIGASVQRGTQVLPPGMTGSDSEDYYGVDLQFVAGRLGIRAEYSRGDMPSRLLSLEPEFSPGFEPGLESWGAATLFDFRLTSRDDLYWRWDRFDNDPVTGADIRAFNIGYLRQIGASSRRGIDYQSKNDVTFNDDELNSKFTVSWNVLYE